MKATTNMHTADATIDRTSTIAPVESRASAFNNLLKNRNIWQASNMNHSTRPGIASGFPEFDRVLPGNGWPTGGVTELLYDRSGIGELRLLMPALAHLSQQNRRWQLWVNPPCIPYAPALLASGINLAQLLLVRPETAKEMLWVVEKALASDNCSAVLAWPSSSLKPQHIRRLQVAARDGNCWSLLFRSTRTRVQASPAELRILLQPDQPAALSDHARIRAKIIKRRGGWTTDFISIELNDDLNRITPAFAELPVPDTRPTPAVKITKPVSGHRIRLPFRELIHER